MFKYSYFCKIFNGKINFDNIIDCGNIIYNNQGKINYNNLNIINQLNGNNLLIIHTKHKKNLNNDVTPVQQLLAINSGDSNL